MISVPMRDLEEKKMHLMCKQTNKHTDGHGDSMTELAQWANSVKMDGLCLVVELAREGLFLTGLLV